MKKKQPNELKEFNEPSDAEKLLMYQEREQKESMFRAQKCAERISQVLREYNCGTQMPVKVVPLQFK